MARHNPFQHLSRAGTLLGQGRKGVYTPLLLAWFLCAGLWAGIALSPPPLQAQAPASDLILVGVAPELTPVEAASLFAEQGLVLARMWPDFDLAAVRPRLDGSARAAGATAAALARVRALPAVQYAELDGRIEAAVAPAPQERTIDVPNDPLYAEQWALARLDMPTAWGVSQGDPGVVVAVIDSGVEITHEDLGEAALWTNLIEQNGQPNVDDDGNGKVDDLHGWDWVQGDNSPDDLFGHGTHVAGTLAATIDNSIGVAGMGSRLRVLPLRVLDERGSGAVSDLVDALAYARSQGVRVVNLSLVLRFNSIALHSVIRQLYADDILIVAATGNYGDRVYWPAAYTETLAIAAVDRNDQRAVFSNPGPETDVAAPGADILSTYKENSYYRNDGTSMAVPHAAALAALIWSLRPDLDRAGVVDLIQTTAVDVNVAQAPGHDDELGHGRIDVVSALLAASEAVRLDVRVPPGTYLSAGHPFQLPVRLTVTGTQGAELPVHGGVIQYELRGPTSGGSGGGASGAQVDAGFLIGDESGHAAIDLVLPDEAGLYALNLSVGRRQQGVELSVQDGPLLLSLQPAAPSIEVGSGAVAVAVWAQTGDGDLYEDALRLTLRTSLGHWDDGTQERTLLVAGGRVTETLYAGETAGSAELTLATSGQTHRTSILIKPGSPHRIAGPERIFGHNDGTGATVELRLTIYDRFDNQLWDSSQVNFYSLGGRFTPESARAVNGEVTTQLFLGSWLRDPVPIWAMIPGSFAVYRAEAYLLSNPIYMPFVENQGPDQDQEARNEFGP